MADLEKGPNPVLSVARFDELPDDATSMAGGKGASLSRMAGAGLPVPPGFVVCAGVFDTFLHGCGGHELIAGRLHELDVDDAAAVDVASREICRLITAALLPGDIDEAIRQAHQNLERGDRVAVRSSAVCEDGATASFAGQQETFLNVSGADAVVSRVRDCWASLFAPRALFYRARKGSLQDTRMAVVVQEMVAADKSGVMFTVDPIRNRRHCMVIEAAFGLGDDVVSGAVTPDHYVIARDDGAVVDEFIPEEPGRARVLRLADLNRLRALGLRVEHFFGSPQDVEWCLRGADLLLLQSRPITTLHHG